MRGLIILSFLLSACTTTPRWSEVESFCEKRTNFNKNFETLKHDYGNFMYALGEWDGCVFNVYQWEIEK